jgi:hypothetical protein
MPFGALLESLQVDDVPHACPHHETSSGHAAFSRRREWSRWAGSIVILENPRGRPLIASKNTFRSAKTKYFVL